MGGIIYIRKRRKQCMLPNTLHSIIFELDYLQFTAAIDFCFPDAMFSTEHGVKGEEYGNKVVFVISKRLESISV